MSQNVTTECHTFSNLWYKATFTFYVWIGLGMALKLKKRGWFTQTPYTTRCDTLWPRRIVGPVFKWICHIYASYTLCFPAWTASSAHNWWHHSYFPPSPAWQYPAHCHSGLPDGAESARGGDNVVYWKEPNWRSIRILRWHRVLVLRSISFVSPACSSPWQFYYNSTCCERVDCIVQWQVSLRLNWKTWLQTLNLANTPRRV